MEKENKKVRDEARKDYNETVRVSTSPWQNQLIPNKFHFQSLVYFLRKRDPRYKTHLASQKMAVASGSGARAPINKRQRQRPRPPAITTYVEQEWQKTSSQNTASAYDEYGGNQNEWAGGQDGQEEWECVACGKTFRSEKAWGNHERSNKHLKEVARYEDRATHIFDALSHAKPQSEAADGGREYGSAA